MNYHLAIIGAGNMGAAFYRGLSGTFERDMLSVCDANEGKLAALGAEHSSIKADDIVNKADAVLFAVKPQMIDACLSEMKTSLSGKLIISIMAGISLERLKKETGATRIVRSMPNLGAQVGRSFTGWIATDDVNEEDKTFVKDVFGTIGDEVELQDENMIDAITAGVGVGPAYFFLLADMLEGNAKKMGFSEDEARAMSQSVLSASAQLLETGEKSSKEWRQAVASKGGVTEHALKVLEEGGIEELFSRACERAQERSKELNE